MAWIQLQTGQCLSNGFCNLHLWNSEALVVLSCLTQKLSLIFKSNVQVHCGEQGYCSGAVFWLFQWFWRGKRPLFLGGFAHIWYRNIWINGNGFPLWEGRTRRSLQAKPFCVSYFLSLNPTAASSTWNSNLKGDDGSWCWGKVVGNASQKYLVFWTAGWAGRRSEVKVPPDTPLKCAPEFSLESASTSSLLQSQLAQPALLHTVC